MWLQANPLTSCTRKRPWTLSGLVTNLYANRHEIFFVMLDRFF